MDKLTDGTYEYIHEALSEHDLKCVTNHDEQLMPSMCRMVVKQIFINQSVKSIEPDAYVVISIDKIEKCKLYLCTAKPIHEMLSVIKFNWIPVEIHSSMRYAVHSNYSGISLVLRGILAIKQ